mmetsp:Transcript_12245/g.34441  ORF Transcript_12245/g.34441 Transcript_12245/m.34441 type:complete len:280 (+) Transcript_12245:2-841(+)
MGEDAQAEYFSLAENADAAGEFLSATLGLPNYRHDTREAVKIDYATHVLNFGRRMGLSGLRISTLFTISQSILQIAVNGEPKSKAQEMLKNFLLGLCTAMPKPDDYKFSPDQIGEIAKFFADGIFQYFRILSHVFQFEQPLEQTDVSLLVETVQIRPDLHEAYIEEDWKKYNDDIAAKIEAERVAAEEARIAEEEKAEKLAQEQALIAAESRRKAEMAKVPQSLEEAVNKLVALRLTEEKQKMEASYKERETVLLLRIQELEKEVTVKQVDSGKGAKKK